MQHDPWRRRLLLAGAGMAGLVAAGLSPAAVQRSASRDLRRAAWPAWRRAMPAGTWCAIPAANTIRAIDPACDPALNPYLASNPDDDRGPWGGVIGIRGVLDPWCGACFDRDRDTLWLPLGGGHQDYAGNEAYSIRLADEVPTWHMPRPPSGSIPLGLIELDDGQESSGNYADGRPRAIHSYNKHVFVPGRGPFCAMQGSTYRSGQAGPNRSLLLDRASGEWSVLAATMDARLGAAKGGACHDATRDVVWWLGDREAQLGYFDFADGQWHVMAEGSSMNVWSTHALTHVPEHDVLVVVSSNLPQRFAVWDATTAHMTEPGADNAPPAQLAIAGGPAGAVWVPRLNAVAMWHNREAASTGLISLLRAPAQPRSQPWSWDTLPVSSANTVLPSVAAANGTYGRFGYAPGLAGFHLLNGVDEPVYFFALDDGDEIFRDGFEHA